jgi:hypothetical protein
MADSNLTTALEGSLRLVSENPFSDHVSPLLEATPDSVDELLDRVNSCFVEGLPEKVTDSDLLRLVEIYRSQALRWTQEEEIKKTKTKRAASRAPVEAVDIDLL